MPLLLLKEWLFRFAAWRPPATNFPFLIYQVQIEMTTWMWSNPLPIENLLPSQEVVWLGCLSARTSRGSSMVDSSHHFPRHRLLRLALPRHPLRRTQATDQGPCHQNREAICSPCKGKRGWGRFKGLRGSRSWSQDCRLSCEGGSAALLWRRPSCLPGPII